MQHVLLLRAPEEEGPDRYEVAFEGKGYVPLSVPVLETVLVHMDELRDKIVHAEDLSGVIITSKRAVEAWCHALRSMSETTQVTIPFYVVGEATAAAAASRMPHADVRGSDSGTAARLASFILAEGVEGRRMLYLTGDKNRETLAGMLTAGGVALDTLEVYRTTASTSFRAALARAPAAMDWVVYFAPSAAALVTPVLRDMGMLKVAAIGPTTAAFLSETLGVRVDIVSPNPTPDALVAAVVAYDA